MGISGGEGWSSDNDFGWRNRLGISYGSINFIKTPIFEWKLTSCQVNSLVLGNY